MAESSSLLKLVSEYFMFDPLDLLPSLTFIEHPKLLSKSNLIQLYVFFFWFAMDMESTNLVLGWKDEDSLRID